MFMSFKKYYLYDRKIKPSSTKSKNKKYIARLLSNFQAKFDDLQE